MNKKPLYLSLLFILIALGVLYGVVISGPAEEAPKAVNIQSKPIPQDSFNSGLPMGRFDIKTGDELNLGGPSDIYLYDFKTKKSLHAGTFSNVSKSYYPGTYINGTLYLLKRTTLDSKASDQIWKYKTGETSKLIAEGVGMDFRVSDDEKYIAVLQNEYLSLLDKNAELIKSFTTSELLIPESQLQLNFAEEGFNKNDLWLRNTFGPSLAGLTKIDLNTLAARKYPLDSNTQINYEYRFNPENVSVVYTTFPLFFDAEDHAEYMRTKSKIELRVYNVITQKNTLISTHAAYEMRPSWINSNTIEYNDPQRNRVQKVIKL